MSPEDRRDCYWLYVVTNCAVKPTLQEPIRDPAKFTWKEVIKVAHYWLEVNAMTPAPEGAGGYQSFWSARQMMSFRGTRLQDLRLPLVTVWLLESLAESKGRQQLFEKQSPQLLTTLREMALIESTESSNRIEGVTVEKSRLRPLVLGKARPR